MHTKMSNFVSMFNVSLWIARRLRLSGSSGNSLSAGTVIAVCGVAVAVAIMELTLTVVTGFKHQISRKVIGLEAEIAIATPYDYSTGMTDDFVRLDGSLAEAIGDFADNHPAVIAMQMPAMIKTDNDFAGMLYLGFDKKHDTAFERENIIAGEWPDFNSQERINDLVVSRTTADKLGLGVGDKVYSCFFTDGNMKMRRHSVSGIYESNLGEFDDMVAYASLAGLQRVAGVDSLSGTRIEFSGFDKDEITNAASDLQSKLMDAVHSGTVDRIYPVTTVLQTGAIYFNWLSLLDTNVGVIFILMLCVSGFTLISSMFLVMLDRIPTIGVLRSLGASRLQICRIFMGMGMKLAFLGLTVGNIIGIGLSMLQYYTHFLTLDPHMYYLKYVPVELQVLPLVVLNVAIVFVSAMVLYVPSLSASRVAPTAAMKFE